MVVLHVVVQYTGAERSDNTNSDLRDNFQNTWTKSLFIHAFSLLLQEYSTGLRLYLNLPSDLTASDQKTFSQRNTEPLRDE